MYPFKLIKRTSPSFNLVSRGIYNKRCALLILTHRIKTLIFIRLLRGRRIFIEYKLFNAGRIVRHAIYRRQGKRS